jgi:hypothetical protein
MGVKDEKSKATGAKSPVRSPPPHQLRRTMALKPRKPPQPLPARSMVQRTNHMKQRRSSLAFSELDMLLISFGRDAWPVWRRNRLQEDVYKDEEQQLKLLSLLRATMPIIDVIDEDYTYRKRVYKAAVGRRYAPPRPSENLWIIGVKSVAQSILTWTLDWHHHQSCRHCISESSTSNQHPRYNCGWVSPPILWLLHVLNHRYQTSRTKYLHPLRWQACLKEQG